VFTKPANPFNQPSHTPKRRKNKKTTTSMLDNDAAHPRTPEAAALAAKLSALAFGPPPAAPAFTAASSSASDGGSAAGGPEDEGLPMPEPFKIKMVEAISLLPRGQREARLREAGYNVFCLRRWCWGAAVRWCRGSCSVMRVLLLCIVQTFTCTQQRQQTKGQTASYFYPPTPPQPLNPPTLRSDEVFIDLLTDSGMSALSDLQWAGMLATPQAYAGSSAFFALRDVVRDLMGFKHVLPEHQVRFWSFVLAAAVDCCCDAVLLLLLYCCIAANKHSKPNKTLKKRKGPRRRKRALLRARRAARQTVLRAQQHAF
jgi:hypothetical protein